MKVKPKKHLGQHFLKDLSIAQDIAEAITFHNGYTNLLEVGPGTGVLTDFYMFPKSTDWKSKMENIQFSVAEIDRESVMFLKKKYDSLKIIEGDILEKDLDELFDSNFGIVGNFPYNISSQLFFKALEYKDKIQEMVCMLQKEVAQRLCAGPGTKDYGILSIFLQVYYDMEYLFTVQEHVFEPPPKVKSGVIRLKRNKRIKLDCDEVLFKKVVKQAFNMRRKTLRNALKPLGIPADLTLDAILDLRAEQLSIPDFVRLTQYFAK
jgi:16S rRNA (adenine1518-N6/adenine1519-N6)-dimethyltransferase